MSKAIRTGAGGAAGESAWRARLPRWLNRYLRTVTRAEWRMPRHAGIKATAVLFVATGLTGVIAGDRVQETINWLSSNTGLSVAEVKITGQSETSETDVLDRLQLASDASLATLDVNAARDRIQTLPWVEKATLRKIYPATLKIAIEERKPYVVWQHDQSVSVIDDAGMVIADASGIHYQELLRVVGTGADKRAAEALALVAAEPAISSHVKAAVLVAERRWNLILDNGVTLMLPQDKPEAALAQIAALDASKSLLNRDIASLDLRLGNRMFVRLTPDAAARRDAEIKEQDKLAKRKAST